MTESENITAEIRIGKIPCDYSDRYRPSYHFTVADKWLNDPNGLVYDEKEELWHMFFQYGPDANDATGRRIWGHTVSRDLVHWTGEEIAIDADGLGQIWSGCCVIDRKNTSGFFDGTVDPRQRFVAVFSYSTQIQAVAFSADGGYTWNKYKSNPVIASNDFGSDFRDPKVQWIDDPTHENGGFWLMIVAGGRARIFTSDNLKDWIFNSELSLPNGEPIVNECPDLFALPVNGDKNRIKWVYTGSGRFYVVGNLVKNRDGLYEFIAETPKLENAYCGDCYATTSYFNDPSGRRILLSWITDFSANRFDCKEWNGIISLPYETALLCDDGTYRLCSNPVKELGTVEGNRLVDITDKAVGSNPLEGICAKSCLIDLSLDIAEGGTVWIKLFGNAEIKIADGRLALTTSEGIYRTDLTPSDSTDLKVYVDNSVIEIFADGGREVVWAKNYWQEKGHCSISTENTPLKINRLVVTELKGIHRKNNLEAKNG